MYCKLWYLLSSDSHGVKKSMFVRSVGSGVETGPVRSGLRSWIGLGTDLGLGSVLNGKNIHIPSFQVFK